VSPYQMNKRTSTQCMQANLKTLLHGPQNGKPCDGTTDEQNLKLARFWLQNAYKLAMVAPGCVAHVASDVVVSAHALHACFVQPATPYSGMSQELALSSAREERHSAMLALVAQFLLARCRYCCMAALVTLPEAVMHSSLASLCTPASADFAAVTNHVLLAHLALNQSAAAVTLACPLLLSGIISLSSSFQVVTTTMQSMHAFLALAEQLASLLPSHAAVTLTPQWLQCMAADLSSVVAAGGPASAEVLQTLLSPQGKRGPVLRAVRSLTVAQLSVGSPQISALLSDLLFLRLQSSTSAALLAHEPFSSGYCRCVEAASDVWIVCQSAECLLYALRQHVSGDILSHPCLCLSLSALLVARPEGVSSSELISKAFPSESMAGIACRALTVARWSFHCRQSALTPARDFLDAHCAAAMALVCALLGAFDSGVHLEGDLLGVQQQAHEVACKLLVGRGPLPVLALALTLLQQVCPPRRTHTRCVCHDMSVNTFSFLSCTSTSTADGDRMSCLPDVRSLAFLCS
jgi:hypothetical protein